MPGMLGILGMDSMPVPHTTYLVSMDPAVVSTNQRCVDSFHVAPVTSVSKRKSLLMSSFFATNSR